MDRRDRLDVFDVAVLIILVGMIVLSPLAMGSVAPWAKNSIFVLSLFVALLWILQAMARGRLVLVRDPVYIFIGFFLLVVCLQLVPLSPGLLEKISPATVEVYERTLPTYVETGQARTLSLTPYHTEWELRRIAAFILVFLIIVNTFRTRAQVLTLVLAMIAVGVFEAVYGFADFMAGGKNIFWNDRVITGHRVSGTFVNKNHFAGLLEMIVPMTLGLCMAVVPGRIAGGSLKARAVAAISSTGLHRQILLGILIVLMTTAIFFSLSRAGMSATIGAWIPFFLFMGLATGSRRFTLTVLLLILAVLCVFFSSGSGIVVDRVEETFAGETVPWEGRFDIWKSCWSMMSDFPLLGTGLGTFKEAFERYQSSLFGDKYAAFAHNDWLQVICETGIIGGLAAIGGILLLFLRLARRTLDRRDTFCRWLAIGALAGSLAILIHSFFDFNLYKITSNGLVFAVILGLWHVTANMKGRNRGSRVSARAYSFSVTAKPVRVAVSLAALALTGFLVVQPVRSAAADIRFNRYLALTGTELEQSRLYHFLPSEVVSSDLSSREEARAELVKACELDRENPLYLFFRAVESAGEADAMIRREASSIAKTILDHESGETIDELGPLEEALSSALLGEGEMAEQYLSGIEAAERSVREAIDGAPSTCAYHLFLAGLVGFDRGESVRSLDDGESDAVLWLAPNKPRALFHAGKSVLLSALNRDWGSQGAPDLTFVFDAFRRCISIDPLYAEKIYPLVTETLEGTESLFSATPDTMDGYEQLTRYLQEKGQWGAALSTLDNMKRLCGLSVDSEAHNEAVPADTQLSISRRRAEALGILGRYEESRQESRIYRTLLRKEAGEGLKEAFFLRGKRHYSEAYAEVLEILEEDWANPDALVLAADLARMPGVTDGFSFPDTPMDHLFRLVIQNRVLSSGLGEKALAVLDKLTPKKEEDRFLHALVKGSVLVLTGKCRDGIPILRDIEAAAKSYPNTGHLVQHYLGSGYECRGLPEEAREAYENVLRRVPLHRDAMEHLQALDPGSTRTGLPGPHYRTETDFGGEVRLLGYAKGRESDSSVEDCPSITLYWELIDRDAESCKCHVQLLDRGMELIGQTSRQLCDLKEKPRDIFYCGEMVGQEIRLPDEGYRVKYVRIWVLSQQSSPLPADNGESRIVLKVLP